jgi:translation initiation factor 2 subunit 2
MDDAAKVEQVTAEMDDLSFDATLKKKKPSSRKKSVAFEDPSTAEVTPAKTEEGTSPASRSCISITDCMTDGAAEESMFPAKKKSAKKILKDTAADAEDDGAEEKPADDGELDFSSLKKKKKKRVIDDQIAALDAQLEEAGVVDDKEVEIEGEDPFKGEGDAAPKDENEEEAWLKSDRDYTYEEVSISPLVSITNNSYYIVYFEFSVRIILPLVSARKSLSPHHLSSEKVPSEPFSPTSTTKQPVFTVL